MNILVDENIPLTTVRALRVQGHDVLDIRGTTDEGIPDYALWDMAQQEERLLIVMRDSTQSIWRVSKGENKKD